jgi:hypothetical protein
MRFSSFGRIFCISLAVLLAGAVSALAQSTATATATISTTQTSAPFDYTLTVHNTGSTNIGTVWFAWAPPFYDFMTSIPTNLSGPTGWTTQATNYPPIPSDGYAFEAFNSTGSAIAAGGTGTFSFTDNESPAALQGNSYLGASYPSLLTYVYVGGPETDPGFAFDTTVTAVPEPASLALAGIGGVLALLAWGKWRRQQQRGAVA